ncbi:uncharacterized protein LOC106156120 [Lingula anatina]|uniref:Uncharacterized protein LOC106154599 n=1 Tax=Lingula anatina TaxID=7574 RepID=A0A1S3HHI0_LINAN|nr:uncharacterized protein LOC106154599 [Lingula anatina]XP_013386681.1 uncharacterized protein LOC106156120 [Lingula anatina]|eukprot:XP_013384449.1 uncharacterized protein LOC106154599 [Lingula anatina]
MSGAKNIVQQLVFLCLCVCVLKASPLRREECRSERICQQQEACKFTSIRWQPNFRDLECRPNEYRDNVLSEVCGSCTCGPEHTCLPSKIASHQTDYVSCTWYCRPTPDEFYPEM